MKKQNIFFKSKQENNTGNLTIISSLPTEERHSFFRCGPLTTINIPENILARNKHEEENNSPKQTPGI